MKTLHNFYWFQDFLGPKKIRKPGKIWKNLMPDFLTLYCVTSPLNASSGKVYWKSLPTVATASASPHSTAIGSWWVDAEAGSNTGRYCWMSPSSTWDAKEAGRRRANSRRMDTPRRRLPRQRTAMVGCGWMYTLPTQHSLLKQDRNSGLILGLHPANERRRYFVTTSRIGWVQT